MPINVSVKELVDIVKAISASLKQIQNSNETMKSNLKRLGITFQDKGFDTVCGMISNSERNLNEAVPELNYISSQLIKYIKILKRGGTI